MKRLVIGTVVLMVLVLGAGPSVAGDGGAGNDRIVGTTSADVLRGGVGADVILGGSGHDEIHGGLGADFIRGGKGIDVCYVGWRDVVRGCEILR